MQRRLTQSGRHRHLKLTLLRFASCVPLLGHKAFHLAVLKYRPIFTCLNTTTDMDGLWFEQRSCQDNSSETKHPNTSALRSPLFPQCFAVSRLCDTTFLLIRPLWRHDLSASPWEALLSLLPQPPPLCCLIAVKKKSLRDYRTSDWNAVSLWKHQSVHKPWPLTMSSVATAVTNPPF